MSNLLLTNSLTRKKEIFKPINPKKISLYACGPTVYDSPHVGNARSLVVFDVLYRILKTLYRSNVTYVRNITDVDDRDVIKLTLKLNIIDIAPVIQTFERYKYNVAASYNQSKNQDNLVDRYDLLMRYLNP